MERFEQINEIRKIVREILRENVTFDNNRTFIPLPNVAQAAQEALNAVSKNNLTVSGTDMGSGRSKAKELASKQAQTFDMMKRMKSFFSTNQEAYNAEKAAGKDINSSSVIQAWFLHGAESCRDWINQELDSLHKDNLNTKKNLRLAGGAGTNKGMGIFSGTNMISTNNNRTAK